MLVFNKGLDGFFHSMIPARLRETLGTSSATYVRVRALSAILVSITLIIASSSTIMTVEHWLFHPQLLKNDLVSWIAVLLLLLQTTLFYRFNNYWISGLAFTNFYFLVIAILLILSGGYDAPSKTTLLTCPMIAFLIGGRQEGLQNTMITVLFGLGLLLLKQIEFDLPNIFRDEDPYVIFSVNWVISLLIIVACIIVYETELQNTHTLQNQITAKTDNKRDNIFDTLMPPVLREALSADSAGYVRVRTLSMMLSMATLMSALMTIILVVIHFLFFKDQLIYDLAVFVITLAFGLQTWFFYKVNNFWISSLLLCYFYFIVILLLVSFNGGYDSSMMILFVMSPIAFFMLGGIQQGIQNTIFVILVGLFFAIMKSIGFEFVNFFHASRPLLTYGITFVITTVCISVCILEYDTQLQKRN